LSLSLLAFFRCRTGLQGFSLCSPCVSSNELASDLRGLGVAFKAPTIAPESPSTIRKWSGFILLSWDSSSWCSPFGYSCCASSPRRHCCHRSASRCQATNTFRPRGFSPPRRFTPHTGFGFIAPRNRMKFATFLGLATHNPQPKPTISGKHPPFPAARFTPLEEFPSPVAVPHHCGRCPPVVLSRPSPWPHRSETQDLVRFANRPSETAALCQPKPPECTLYPPFRTPHACYRRAEALLSRPQRSS